MENIKNCFMFNNCNRKDCNADFCLRKYKLDFLYNAALLSDSQKPKLTLLVDADGTDFDKFTRLAEIEQNIETFLNNVVMVNLLGQLG